MPKNKKSFFERLTGSVNAEEENSFTTIDASDQELSEKKGDWMDEEEDGQLTIDMRQTGDDIIIESIVAGVKPDDLDVDITRDMITIRGKREKHHRVSEDGYFYQELYWGSFSRSILLPQEIDAEEAEAVLKDGMLKITLPKLDKDRIQKIKIKSN